MVSSGSSLESSTVASPHLDLVSTVAFNPLGSHLATASLDHHVRVVHPSPTTPGAWDYCPRTWKAHDGAVLSLSWADPEFGTVFATGGVDGVVKIWRQDEPPPRPGQYDPEGVNAGNKPSSTAGPGWALAASLTDCRGTVRGISFAPAHFGLKLAAIASDSHLRVWDCIDATAALREWTLVEDVDLAGLGLAPSTGSNSSGPHGYTVSSTLGAGGAGGASGYDTASGTGSSYGGGVGGSGSGPSANAAFPSASSVASSANHGSSAAGSSVGYGGGNTRAGGTVESDGGWAVSWCPEHWWGERLAVSSGPNGVIRLFHFSPTEPWHNYLNLIPSRLAQSQGLSTHLYASSASGFHHSSDEPSHSAFSTSSAGSSTDPASRDGSSNSTHTPPTSSLSFAPPSGRSYLLLAAGARDGRARVWRITPPPLSLPRSSSSGQNAGNSGGIDGAGNNSGNDDDMPESEGDWSARLEVELEPLASGDALPQPGPNGGINGPTNAPNSSRRGTGLGGAMSAVKVEWNILGTVLSTSGGEDGKVRVWKPTYTGQWRQVAALSTQESSGPGAGLGG
ncbi:hypothetical protein RHOSPDRAFT_33795 [Rhodotorula sp. JG-1b]|nr:hypothetical protein RHOSPDRAFT_33795 [Rhodotorula sp. JG-1b]